MIGEDQLDKPEVHAAYDKLDEFTSIAMKNAHPIITPMNPERVAILFQLVLHGATVEEYSERYQMAVSEDEDERDYQAVRDYRILFPDGTEKHLGASFSPKKRSYFMLFPDGLKVFFRDIYILGGWRTVLLQEKQP